MRAESDDKREEWLKCLQKHANVYTVRYKKNPNVTAISKFRKLNFLGKRRKFRKNASYTWKMEWKKRSCEKWLHLCV